MDVTSQEHFEEEGVCILEGEELEKHQAELAKRTRKLRKKKLVDCSCQKKTCATCLKKKRDAEKEAEREAARKSFLESFNVKVEKSDNDEGMFCTL